MGSKKPFKICRYRIIGVSGAESLINKKKFSDVLGNNVKKTTDTLTPIVDDVVDAGVKSSKSIISSGENVVSKLSKSIFGNLGYYIKWITIIIISTFIIYELFKII